MSHDIKTYGDIKPGDLLVYYPVNLKGEKGAPQEAHLVIGVIESEYRFVAGCDNECFDMRDFDRPGRKFILLRVKASKWASTKHKMISEYWWRNDLEIPESKYLEIIR